MAVAKAKKALYLFHGSDHYSAQQKVKHWTDEFIKKYGDLNMQTFQGEDFTASDFQESIATVPFLSEKKLIVIRDFLADAPTAELQEVAEMLEEIPDYNVVVFLERGKPDGRTAIYKRLNKIGQAIEFPDLEKFELVQWITKTVQTKGGAISSREAGLLAETVGADLWQMSHELEKLTLYSNGAPITSEAIEKLASANVDASVFKLTDYLGQKNIKLAFKTLQNLLASNQDLFQIFFMLVRHVRILIQVKTLHLQNLSKDQMVAKMKEHPFVVTNALSQSKNFSLSQLTSLYETLLKIDVDSKSGRIKTATNDNSELRLAIEQLLVKACLPQNV
jgi:DNA polymerase-3 subunit delta